VLCCAGAAPARAADPILMFLLSVARDLIEAHARRAPAPLPPPVQVPELSRAYPGTVVEPEHLRRLIDESFVYLSDGQRGEVFASLHAALSQPENGPMRAGMIDHFVRHALAVRAAHARLAQLSWREKELLAEEFRKEVAGLSGEEQTRLGELLRKGLLPVPSDLNQLLLAVLEAR